MNGTRKLSVKHMFAREILQQLKRNYLAVFERHQPLAGMTAQILKVVAEEQQETKNKNEKAAKTEAKPEDDSAEKQDDATGFENVEDIIETLDANLFKHVRDMFQNLEEGALNSTVEDIFAKVDNNSNGILDYDELTSWVMKQGEQGAIKSILSQDLWKLLDENNDGLVSKQEYTRTGPSEGESDEKTDDGQLNFEDADVNKDKLLTKEEYVRYLLPQFLTEMKDHLAVEAKRVYDADGDGKITKDEYTIVIKKVDPKNIKGQLRGFDNLDKNSDGIIEEEELHRRMPEGNLEEITRKEVMWMLSEGDTDQDKQLSKEEVLKNNIIFLSLGLSTQINEQKERFRKATEHRDEL